MEIVATQEVKSTRKQAAGSAYPHASKTVLMGLTVYMNPGLWSSQPGKLIIFDQLGFPAC